MLKIFKHKKQLSKEFIGFLQAAGLTLYAITIGYLLWNGENWFGKFNSFVGPVFVLILLILSALVCALIAFGYPIYLFWDKKKSCEALQIVAYTALWLVLIVIMFMVVLFFV